MQPHHQGWLQTIGLKFWACFFFCSEPIPQLPRQVAFSFAFWTALVATALFGLTKGYLFPLAIPALLFATTFLLFCLVVGLGTWYNQWVSTPIARQLIRAASGGQLVGAYYCWLSSARIRPSTAIHWQLHTSDHSHPFRLFGYAPLLVAP